MPDKARRRSSRFSSLQIPSKQSSPSASVSPSPSSSLTAYSPLLPLRHHTNTNGEQRLTNPLYDNTTYNLSDFNHNTTYNQNEKYASHNARRPSNATSVMRRDLNGFEKGEDDRNKYDYEDTEEAYYASKKGDFYDAKSARRDRNDFARTPSERRRLKMDWRIIGVLTLIATVVRLFRISQPDSVVFDEVHFGGFASKYIRGAFFMDVHPPLGKLLIAFAGILAGFDGKFDFKEIGKDYIQEKVPYISMRLMPAIMGIMLVPIAYMTVRRSGCSSAAAAVASVAILFENGLTTQARLILLDSPLLFFIALAPFTWVNFLSWQSRPFSANWWFWLAMTGIALGLAVSVKWVGLFVIALIGLSTIKNLWDLLGDLRVKPNTLLRHFAARIGCLIVLPIIIYMFFFEIHFLALPHSGDGDGFFSSEFQQTLSGKSLPDTPVDVAYGAKLFIRHVATNGGYLHSHTHNWVGGSKQQQITLYPHRDENSYFIIKKSTPVDKNTQKLEYVKHGDLVRLEHAGTNKHLHSHDIRPPISDGENHNEVSAYGEKNFEGDSNDHWRVDIVEGDSSDPVSKTHLRAIRSKFRLVHVNTGCHLFSHAVKLPDYAFGQQEVTCMKSAKKEKAVWRIDVNEHPDLPPNTEIVNYVKPGFFGKFFEVQRVMWTTNKGLTDSHPYDSRPLSWPFLTRGISFWTKERKQVYLIGNPVVWWTVTACVLLFLGVEATLMIRKQMGYTEGTDAATDIKHHYESTIWFFFLGWILHYVPFFLMGRQLFLHHYFPALYFGVLLTAVVFDFLTRKMSNAFRWGTVVLISMLLLWVFVKFSFITYGLPNTKDACLQAKWMENWDFDCGVFPEERPTVLGVVPPSPTNGGGN